jgi:hypothetical protein
MVTFVLSSAGQLALGRDEMGGWHTHQWTSFGGLFVHYKITVHCHFVIRGQLPMTSE